MKTPSQDLFLLINALSKTEKRYFKKFSELHGKEDNNYLQLFDAIARQKEFDEEALKREFKGEPFMRQFPVAKNYLYSKIMDALEFFHRESSVYSSVRRNIYRAELLQKKGLYDQSMKSLQKAKQDAHDLDLFHAQIEIHTLWEFNAHLEKYDLKKLEALHDDAIKTSALLNESIACKNLSLQMVNLYNQYYQTRNKKFMAQAEELMKNPYFKNPAAIGSFSGKLRIYEAGFFYWYAKGDLAAACAEGEKAAALCLAYPAHLKNNIKMYMVLLSNLFYLRCEQKKFDEAYECLNKLKGIYRHVKTYSQRTKFFYLHDNALMHYLYHTGKIKELGEKLPSLISSFEEHKKELSDYEKIALLTTISISYFYLGNLKSSIFSLNTLRNEYDLSANPEAQYFLNIFYLIVHYESGHHEILPYLVQSFQRFLKKRSSISKIESAVADLLKKQPQQEKGTQLAPAFNQIKKELQDLPHDTAHQYIFKYFDLTAWLESKMKNRPFLEIIKEKAKQ